MKSIIQSRRLVLRPYQTSDFSAWVKHWTEMDEPKNEWDISARKRGRDLSRKAFREVIKAQNLLRKEDKVITYIIFKKDGTVVGGASLMDIARGVFHNAYLGYSLSNKYWGQGYGKEAIRACILAGFKEHGLHRIEAGIAPNNRRSLALAKSLGMRKEGRKVRALFLDNRWQDIMVYALTCEDLGLKYRGEKPSFSNRR